MQVIISKALPSFQEGFCTYCLLVLGMIATAGSAAIGAHRLAAVITLFHVVVGTIGFVFHRERGRENKNKFYDGVAR